LFLFYCCLSCNLFLGRRLLNWGWNPRELPTSGFFFSFLGSFLLDRRVLETIKELGGKRKTIYTYT